MKEPTSCAFAIEDKFGDSLNEGGQISIQSDRHPQRRSDSVSPTRADSVSIRTQSVSNSSSSPIAIAVLFTGPSMSLQQGEKIAVPSLTPQRNVTRVFETKLRRQQAKYDGVEEQRPSKDDGDQVALDADNEQSCSNGIQHTSEHSLTDREVSSRNPVETQSTLCVGLPQSTIPNNGTLTTTSSGSTASQPGAYEVPGRAYLDRLLRGGNENDSGADSGYDDDQYDSFDQGQRTNDDVMPTPTVGDAELVDAEEWEELQILRQFKSRELEALAEIRKARVEEMEKLELLRQTTRQEQQQHQSTLVGMKAISPPAGASVDSIMEPVHAVPIQQVKCCGYKTSRRTALLIVFVMIVIVVDTLVLALFTVRRNRTGSSSASVAIQPPIVPTGNQPGRHPHSKNTTMNPDQVNGTTPAAAPFDNATTHTGVPVEPQSDTNSSISYKGNGTMTEGPSFQDPLVGYDQREANGSSTNQSQGADSTFGSSQASSPQYVPPTQYSPTRANLTSSPLFNGETISPSSLPDDVHSVGPSSTFSPTPIVPSIANGASAKPPNGSTSNETDRTSLLIIWLILGPVSLAAVGLVIWSCLHPYNQKHYIQKDTALKPNPTAFTKRSRDCLNLPAASPEDV